ncbi:cytochrome P450 CYP12A2-like isoform X2 [Leguminivora glycinivorella]|uniref:cytochrome P450 CYP12A2-like isoform X2 n=1 Tax=Leguminivora glycinivorella TaxID=1035111 RepID=UPI00200E714F|nr:cytochrome P450 CYP12A2-like isoform X2 [Leguminivora glycinivorella]
MQVLKSRSLAGLSKSLAQNVRVFSSATDNLESAKTLKSWKDILGPPNLPIIGQLLQFVMKNKMTDAVKIYNSLHKAYGPIVKVKGNFGSPDMVVMFDVKAIEYVLRSENSMPVRPGFESLAYYRHRHNKEYDSKRLTGLIITEIKSIRDENNTVPKNLDTEMTLWALESIGVVALGTRLNCFDPNLPKDSPARELIKNIYEVFQIPGKLDFGTSLWRWVSTPPFKRAMRLYEEHDSLTKHFIDEALKSIEEAKNNGVEHSESEKPILEKLLEIDVQIAQVMASDMLMAGVDTGAHTALATLYFLATNPEKQKKLREEVMSRQTRRPYLKACLRESMRVLPVATGNARTSTKEYNLLGYRIPKGVMIGLSQQYLSIKEEHYPRPAEEFIPERWLVDKHNPLYYGNTHPFVTSPFGFGVRMCIGRRIAELELETLISKLVENFQINWKGGPIEVSGTSLNYVTGPFNFIFNDIKDST